MTEITGQKELTKTIAAGEIMKISYHYNPLLDIANYTAGELYINSTGDFSGDEYITIAKGGSFNRYRASNGNMNTTADLYLKAEAAGKISVAVAAY